jgi:hypothetical protein
LTPQKKLSVSVTGREEARATELIVARRDVSFIVKKKSLRMDERK